MSWSCYVAHVMYEKVEHSWKAGEHVTLNRGLTVPTVRSEPPVTGTGGLKLSAVV